MSKFDILQTSHDYKLIKKDILIASKNKSHERGRRRGLLNNNPLRISTKVIEQNG